MASIPEEPDHRAYFPALEAAVAAVRKERSRDSLYRRSMDCRQFWAHAHAPGTPEMPMSVDREAADPSLEQRCFIACRLPPCSEQVTTGSFQPSPQHFPPSCVCVSVSLPPSCPCLTGNLSHRSPWLLCSCVENILRGWVTREWESSHPSGACSTQLIKD